MSIHDLEEEILRKSAVESLDTENSNRVLGLIMNRAVFRGKGSSRLNNLKATGFISPGPNGIGSPAGECTKVHFRHWRVIEPTPGSVGGEAGVGHRGYLHARSVERPMELDVGGVSRHLTPDRHRLVSHGTNQFLSVRATRWHNWDGMGKKVQYITHLQKNIPPPAKESNCSRGLNEMESN